MRQSSALAFFSQPLAIAFAYGSLVVAANSWNESNASLIFVWISFPLAIEVVKHFSMKGANSNELSSVNIFFNSQQR